MYNLVAQRQAQIQIQETTKQGFKNQFKTDCDSYNKPQREYRKNINVTAIKWIIYRFQRDSAEYF